MIDWDDAFNNSAYVEGSESFADDWFKRSTETRAELKSEADLAYGAGDRRSLDLFLPKSETKGLVVFVHGGYWQKFDKSYWSYLAQGSVENGWAVAVLSYPLAPAARISVITNAVAQGISFAAQCVSGPMRLIGHSAGGHLVSRMLCKHSDETLLPPQINRRLERVVSVSGVHDLRPLLLTEMNRKLRLTEREAASESPVLSEPLTDIPMTFWVGAEERPEFLRQNRLIAESWVRKGVDVSSMYEPGKHHFSVIESLSQADGALTKELLR